MTIDQRRARRLPTVVLSIGTVVAVAVAMLLVGGAASPAVAFQQTGHWVFNRAESAVVHVDSGTHQADARIPVPGVGTDPLFALQGDRQGFLVGRRTITVFGKSTLTVDSTIPTGEAEVPVGIEVVGGPYLVYLGVGRIVRLGPSPLTIPIGSRVERPVSTEDGTVWLRRIDDGVLCALRRGADSLDCSLQTAPGASGALTVTSSTAAFLDTGQDAVQSIRDAALSGPVAIGTDLQQEAMIGDRDTQGRLPAVVPAPDRLVLADTSGVPALRAGGPPVLVDLGEGRFTPPVAADGVVAVIEQIRSRLLTFGIDGHPLDDVALPPGGSASITRGEDGRIYVDDADGAVTHVVGTDGKAVPVRTGGVVTAVAAAPPDQASLIPPPRRSPTRPTAGPGRPVQQPQEPPSRQPGDPPVQQPNPPPGSGPPTAPPPGDSLPLAPGGVAAVARPDGSVGVSWNAVPGAGVRYSVQVDGRPAASSSGSASSLTGLTPGQQYGITVSAADGAGSGPASPSVAVTPFKYASAPENAKIVIHEAGGNAQISLFWDAPDLGGGRLVGYRVTGPGGHGVPLDTMVTPDGASPLQYNEFAPYCAPTIRYEVRAITTPPGGGEQVPGAVAAASLPSPSDCTPVLTLVSARATGPTTAVVTFTCAENGAGGSTDGDVTLSAEGAILGEGAGPANTGTWKGRCTTNAGSSFTAQLTGLTPSVPLTTTGPELRYTTSYTLTGSISGRYGSDPAANSLTFTMPGR